MRKIKIILFRVRDKPAVKQMPLPKARTFITERKGQAFVFDKSREFIIAKALQDVNTHFSERRAIIMPIFKEIKEHLTARQVAEYYGLRVGRNGMASPVLPELTMGKASSEQDSGSEEDLNLSEEALDFLSQF